jgi:hypothetical protein
MVIAAAVAQAILGVALTLGAPTDPALSTPDVSAAPDETMASRPSQRMQVCESGGMGSDTCNVDCHIVFNYYTTHCNVACRSGFFACCSCDRGCQCVMDHEEMWPLPPLPDPDPDPEP